MSRQVNLRILLRLDHLVGLGIKHLKEDLMKSPIVLLSSLLDDFERLEPDVKGLERDLRTLSRRVKDEGDSFLTVALPALGKAFDRALSEGYFSIPRGFRKSPGRAIPQLFVGMFEKVFDDRGYLLDNPSIGCIRQLRDVLYMFKKAALSEESNEQLDAKAKSGFFDCDEEVRKHTILPDFVEAIKRVSTFLLPGLHSVDFESSWCKHGPGSVAEGTMSNQKWDDVLQAICEDDPAFQRYGFDLVQTALRMSQDLFYLDTDVAPEEAEIVMQRSFSGIHEPISGIAKLISVAKNSTSRRTITIEPGRKMFIQQGLNTLLRDEITRCKVLRRCLALSDQSLNQILALEGSRTGKFVTLDLSSASDLLSLKTVQAVFGNHPFFLEELMAHRSSHVSVGKNSNWKLEKFAGMGNATTFPVQSICFAVIAITVILHVQGRRPSMDSLKRVADLIQVYGDDIIVHEDYGSQVIAGLELAGLRVNQSKSFMKGNFRESCGVDAFRGVDVTPLYVKHLSCEETELSSDAIAAFIAMSNASWQRCYYKFSASVVDMCERSLGIRIPLVSCRSGALGLHSRLDASEFQRWNKKLQRPEVKALVQVSPKRKDKIDGYAALLKFFHTSLLGRSKGHLDKTEVRFKSRIVLRWVPAQAG
jgi:hypothetical protein